MLLLIDHPICNIWCMATTVAVMIMEERMMEGMVVENNSLTSLQDPLCTQQLHKVQLHLPTHGHDQHRVGIHL